MSKNTTMKPLAIALSTTFVTSLATTGVAGAADNPFAMTELSSGYLVADAHAAEGKCGGAKKAEEGKCGGAKKAEEGKCGEGKCGESMKKSMEGKCGEGKCGEGMKKSTEGKCGGMKKEGE